MSLLVEPPRSQARVAGGLLGVAGGEAWRGARGGFETAGPVTAALLDLSRSYASGGGPLGGSGNDPGRPTDVAQRHAGVPASGWLLPVALARSGPDLIDETRSLAIAAGAPCDVLEASVTYVRLAAELFAGQPSRTAIEAATGQPAAIAVGAATRKWKSDEPAGPRLCGIGPIDALAAGIWALAQAGQRLATIAASLVRWCEPWVAAAAAGLLGIRDGCAAVPAQWHRRIPVAEDCLTLAPQLQGDPPRRTRPQAVAGSVTAAAGAGRIAATAEDTGLVAATAGASRSAERIKATEPDPVMAAESPVMAAESAEPVAAETVEPTKAAEPAGSAAAAEPVRPVDAVGVA